MKSPRPKANPRKSAPKMRPKPRDQKKIDALVDDKAAKGAVERGNRNAQPPGPTGYAKGGTVRGMGAAAKGGKFNKNG
jgi:hypothetical protein